jgi:RNA polymerase sigma factor (sigma-70 family)
MLSDEDYPSVLEAARLGAEWAWTAIYRDASPSVLRYLRAHGAREPEDLLGDVFVQVVRALPRFEGNGRDFRAWVFTITRNRLVDEWRRAGRNRAEIVSDDVLLCAMELRDAEQDVLGQLAGERVRAIIGRLSADQRDVIFLRVIADLSIEEAARVLGKSPGAVKSLQVRGLASIQRNAVKEGVSL